MQKTFCETCRKDVSYSVKTADMKQSLRGTEYEFVGKRALCDVCGHEVFAAELEDENLRALYDAYREKNEIISQEEILDIPARYGIGKRPLSVLLGWGEMTFTRYCEGYVPTKQYSQVLRRIHDEPDFYLSILDANRARIRPVAYEKSRRAVLDLIGGMKAQTSKIDRVVDYLLCRCEDITPLALQKALYYIQGFHYAFFGKYVFVEDCEAWVHGPVYRDIYERYSSYHFDPIDGSQKSDDSVFTDSEKTVIDGVIQNICCYSGKTIERFTHSESPWLKTRGSLHAAMNSAKIISKDDIGAYFIEVKRKYDMLTPSDIDSYARRMFERTSRC